MPDTPDHCLVCGKGPLRQVRRHMLRQHRAYLGWDPVDKEWCFIYG